MRRLLLAFALITSAAGAQQAQNPSPMVEHTRAHPRLKETAPPGRREKLDLGELFIPARTHPATLLVFFHGGAWLPQLAGARNHMAVVSIQAGSGSAQKSFISLPCTVSAMMTNTSIAITIALQNG